MAETSPQLLRTVMAYILSRPDMLPLKDKFKQVAAIAITESKGVELLKNLTHKQLELKAYTPFFALFYPAFTVSPIANEIMDAIDAYGDRFVQHFDVIFNRESDPSLTGPAKAALRTDTYRLAFLGVLDRYIGETIDMIFTPDFPSQKH